MAAGVLTSQFVTEGDPVSGLIRYVTDGDVSHVDLVLPFAVTLRGKTYPAGWLLGSRFIGGVAIRPPGYKKFTKIVQVSCTVPNVDAALAFALAQVGKPYNKSAIMDMVLHRDRKFVAGQKSWFCDELNYAIYLAGGLQLLNTDNPLRLTPQEELLSPYWATKSVLR